MIPSVSENLVEVYQSSLEREYATPERVGQREILTAQQEQREAIELATINPCPAPVGEIAPLQAGISFAAIRETLRTYFFDARRMQAVHCALVVALRDGPGANADPDRVRAWFLDPIPIGVPSASGIAIIAKVRQRDGSTVDAARLVVKAPQNPADSLLHEAIVGLRLNPLREKIPNFAYVFSLFSCTPPYAASEKKKLGGFCLRNGAADVPYIVYEGIFPSTSLKKYVATCSGKDFVRAFLQIVFALEEAWRYTGFVHQDLHDDNVQLRKLDSPVSLAYDTSLGRRYIETYEIATMIDFGLSAVQLADGTRTGVYGYEKYGIFVERPFPLYDPYKLLLMSMRSMLDGGNKACFRAAARILRFFNSEQDPETVVRQQSGSFYALPNDPVFNGYTVQQLLEFIVADRAIPRVATARPTAAPLYSCSADPNAAGPCQTYEEALQTIGLSAGAQPRSLLLLFTAYADATPMEKQGVLMRGEKLYEENSPAAIAELESAAAVGVRQCGIALARFPDRGFPPPSEVDGLVACTTSLTDLRVSATALLTLARGYGDANTAERAQVVLSMIEGANKQYVEPGIRAVKLAADAGGSAVYTNALRTFG